MLRQVRVLQAKLNQFSLVGKTKQREKIVTGNKHCFTL